MQKNHAGLTSERLGAAAILAAGLMACCSYGAAAGPACTLDRATGTIIEPQPFLQNAYGVRWSAAAGRVAYMQRDASGYYRVYTVRPDGSGRQAIAQNLPAVPHKHHGVPYWHPSGRFLLFVAQKQDWSGGRLFGNPDYEALPGFGRHDDLWLAAADGSRAWQLTDEPNTKDQGVLMPVFSPDGKRIAWSSRQPGGKYLIEVAEFVEEPEPHLQNVRIYQPGGPAYYETGSFTSDSQRLTYTSDRDTHNFWRSQIYILDLASGNGTRLTAGGDYNEHPTVVATPGGDWIVYMSTKGVDRYRWRVLLGTDWWAMRPDGSGAKRLTHMNVNRPDNAQNEGDMRVACAVAPSPDGGSFLGDVQDSIVRQTGMVKVVRLTCD